MKTLQFLLLAALGGLATLSACDTARDQSYLVPNITGKANELIVVINKTLWDSPLGDSLFRTLSVDYPSLPQAEAYFEISDVAPQAFEGLESLRTFRNLLFVEIDPAHTQASLSAQHSKWAKQQIVVRLKAPNQQAVLQLLATRGAELRALIHKAETDRILRNYQQYANTELIDQIWKQHQIGITLPNNYRVEQRYADFLWLGHETPEISQGIFLYWYPYTAQSQFSKDSLVNRRNAFLQKYVPGPLPNSYMTTEMQLPVEYEQITLRQEYAAKVRGLWFTKGDFMGGPFVSVSKVDKERGRIVTAEGWVYAPKFGKRNYIMQVEQIVESIRFDD